MQWRGRRQSGNIVDRRGMKTAGVLGGGGILIAIIVALLGGDPGAVLDMAPTESSSEVTDSDQPDDGRDFVAVVLADTEDVWKTQFARLGRDYQEPKLVLFSGRVNSACGLASSAVGPFYCPADQQLYIDLDFFSDLAERLGANGDFAQAYVIAHEVGHHVQNLLGVMNRVHEAQRGLDEVGQNRLSVLLELQADCFAGMWARTTEATKQVLEPGDLEEALGAAAAVGDDRLQQRGRGEVVPDAFTHGSSEQRASWFKNGYQGQKIEDCDTFSKSEAS